VFLGGSIDDSFDLGCHHQACYSWNYCMSNRLGHDMRIEGISEQDTTFLLIIAIFKNFNMDFDAFHYLDDFAFKRLPGCICYIQRK
jgi:hypothetical protein